MVKIVSRSIQQDGVGQDRVKVHHFDATTAAAVLADGAGGLSGGGRAADTVVNTLCHSYPSDFGALFDNIIALDRQLMLDPEAGLSTLVTVYLSNAEFFGAVIGDSDALFIQHGELHNLAAEKELKPLLGGGEAFPTLFSGTLNDSVLLLCSDGFSKYVALDDVLLICAKPQETETLLNNLLDAIVMPEGKLQDDASLIVISG